MPCNRLLYRRTGQRNGKKQISSTLRHIRCSILSNSAANLFAGALFFVIAPRCCVLR